MRPARILLATATATATATASATAALAMAAPADATAGDWDKDESSYSSEHDDSGKKYDEPRGGMHTGGGALAAVNEDDWTKDKESKEGGYEKSDKGEYGQSKDGYKESTRSPAAVWTPVAVRWSRPAAGLRPGVCCSAASEPAPTWCAAVA